MSKKYGKISILSINCSCKKSSLKYNKRAKTRRRLKRDI